MTYSEVSQVSVWGESILFCPLDIDQDMLIRRIFYVIWSTDCDIPANIMSLIKRFPLSSVGFELEALETSFF